MSTHYNIYCDESCHLEHDNNKIMVLGGISCPYEFVRSAINDIRAIKQKHGFNPKFEIHFVVPVIVRLIELRMVDFCFVGDN